MRRVACVTLFVVALSLCFVHECHGKLYTVCGLTNDLLRLDAGRSYVGNWVCLVRSESYLNTTAIGNKGRGRMNLGLFQIDNSEYCAEGKPGGKCNITCDNLLNDDINDDFRCAKKIYKDKGWQAWPGWVRNCKNRRDATVLPVC